MDDARLVPAARPPSAWLFELDGVLTDTAALHARAWKEVFDELIQSADRPSGPADEARWRPFDAVVDFARYVDGKPQAEGVRAFLASRGITIPEGGPLDRPGSHTVASLAGAKSSRFLSLLASGGVRVFPGSIELLEALRGAGRRTAVVSASENCRAVLEAGRIAELFDAEVDGVLARRGLRPKPAADTYLFAAAKLRVPAQSAAVVDDATAGVSAGKAGNFGLVIGVTRRVPGADLAAAGADVVVESLEELLA